ncbi:hypothetical protein [Gordonia insulae]|uniref:Low molecular weight antigen MTB12-like C-terminal domain-containing protein n=1 Tax=Gordonia insulae TaxID=2420509 RepID=A0A3G8JP86_9ACTN|nr:hypothetical protein [Gordonia insulae]AZG46279.1 hypothetical protein D7316_02880 [Gordonia insulae]
MSPDYDDTDTGPIGSRAYSAPEADDAEPTRGDERATRGGGDGVNWPTVLMAGGISAIISALVVTIGVVGLLLSDIGRDNNASSNTQPTVVNLGSAQSEVPQAGAPQAAPRATAPGAPAAAAPAPAPGGEGSSADLPAGGASGGGLAPGAAPQPAPEVPAAPQQTQPRQQAQTPTSRPTPSVGQLQGDLNALVGGGSAAQKGQRLEGGQRAATQAQPIVLLLQRFKPLGFTYRVVGPVSVNGNTAKATLELRSPGYQPARMPVYWVWKDGQWKLSNRSICDIGAYAQIPCSL